MRTIYSYLDYREYLSDYYAERKREPHGFSYELFSKQAGIKSPNYLKLVIERKRNLSITNIHQFAKALGLPFHCIQYFEALVLFDQSKVASEKNYYKTRLMEIKRGMPQTRTKMRIGDLLTAWYYPAILTCIDGQSLKSADKEIAGKVGIHSSQAEKAIRILLKHNLVEIVDETYRLKAGYFLIHDRKSTDLVQKQFLKEQIQLGLRTLERSYHQGVAR